MSSSSEESEAEDSSDSDLSEAESGLISRTTVGPFFCGWSGCAGIVSLVLLNTVEGLEAAEDSAVLNGIACDLPFTGFQPTGLGPVGVFKMDFGIVDGVLLELEGALEGVFEVCGLEAIALEGPGEAR